MKITNVTATAESRRRPNPIQDALQSLDTEGVCRVIIETSEGMSGRSAISFGRGERTPDILAHLINDELAPAVVGEDAFLIRAIRDRLWKLTDYHGTLGLALFGIAGSILRSGTRSAGRSGSRSDGCSVLSATVSRRMRWLAG
jgi:L-alanine-DL-glutamate epimerase-like enolase superfamily enzyme